MKGKKKTNTILYIVVFIFVFIMFIATAYSYYLKVIKKENVNVDIKHFNMLVEFNNENQFNIKNIRSGYEEVKEFTVKNYSKDTIGKYNIVFEVITPLSQIVDEGFTYTLESECDSKDNSNKIINIPSTPVPVLSKNFGTATITPNATHTYKLTIKMNNNKYINNSLFSAKINIVNE